MPDQSEVIMGQMEDTRKDLADKLETLEKKVAGTVETMTGTVKTVEQTVENVKESIQETVASVTDTVQNTVQTVEETVGNTVANVKSFFDISRQVDRHPWLMFGGSVLAGYIGGWLLTPKTVHVEMPSPPTPSGSGGGSYMPPPAPAPVAAPAPQQTQQPQQAEEAGESWLGKLTERFSPEVDKLKGLAVGTLFGVARDMVSQWLPDALKQQVTDVINNFTTDLGGQIIREPLMAPQQDGGDSSGHGERSGQPQAAESNPAGSGSRTRETAGSGRR